MKLPFIQRPFSLLILLVLLTGFMVNSALAADPLRLEIHGVSGDELDNVRAALSFPPGLVEDGQVDQRWLERYVSRAPETTKRALQPFGFYSSAVRVELAQEAPGIQVLKVFVELGEPVRLTAVETAVEGPGARRLERRELLDTFPLRQGDVLHQGQYEEAKKEIREQAVALGYLGAEYSVHEIRVRPEDKTAEIALILQTGPRYHFGEVTFSGADTYPEEFLQRYLAFKPDQVFSYSLIGQSQLNLLDSDRFEDVRLIPDAEAAVNDRIPVDVVLKPSAPKRLRPGIGYGTDTGVRGSLLFENLNLFHRGHELKMELNLSQAQQSAIAAYIRPDVQNLDSFTAFRTGYEAEDVDTFETERYTVEAERARGFGSNRKGSIYLKFLLENFTIGEQRDTVKMLLPGVRFSKRGYRELIRPRKGYQYGLELRGGHEALLSDASLLQLLGSGNLLVPLPARFSLFFRFEGSTTLQDNPLEDVPVSLRFFAGGDQSVRGYSYQSLGPENEDGDVTGGKHLLVGSVELERAIRERWGIAVFYDVGNAFNSFSNLDLFQGVGLGGRYYSPVGPIRLDLARQVGVDDPSFRIHLSIGFGW